MTSKYDLYIERMSDYCGDRNYHIVIRDKVNDTYPIIWRNYIGYKYWDAIRKAKQDAGIEGQSVTILKGDN